MALLEGERVWKWCAETDAVDAERDSSVEKATPGRARDVPCRSVGCAEGKNRVGGVCHISIRKGNRQGVGTALFVEGDSRDTTVSEAVVVAGSASSSETDGAHSEEADVELWRMDHGEGD